MVFFVRGRRKFDSFVVLFEFSFLFALEFVLVIRVIALNVGLVFVLVLLF